MSSSIKYILLVLVVVQNAFSKMEIFGIFDRLEECGKPSHPKIKWENLTLSIENGTSMFSSDMEILGDPITAIEIRVNCQRCASREALDTCEDYHTLVTTNGCQFLTLEHLMWTPFMKAVRPETKCPIKSGKYKQTKAWFDVKSFRLFPIEQYYWKLMITMSSHRIRLLTICLDGRIHRKIS